jgi:predicted nucleic acid-binding protein
MLVVADTTPLNYLLLIGHVEVLPALYSRVLIPQAVYMELQRPGTPSVVREWAIDPPSWIEVCLASLGQNPTLDDLDTGERQAIQLALDSGIETVLMDESEGRRAALHHQLKVTGTIAILEKAAQLGLIDFRSALTRLEQTNFRLSAAIRDEFLKRSP